MRENYDSATMARAAIALALCISSLILFRGTISIVSAFFIPAIIAGFSFNVKNLYFSFIYIGLILITLLFFTTQIVFVTAYIFLSIAIRMFLLDEYLKVKASLPNSIIYVILVIIILFLGLWCTEFFLQIPIHTMMLRLSGGNYFKYFGILLIESIFIFIFNILILNSLKFISKLKS